MLKKVVQVSFLLIGGTLVNYFYRIYLNYFLLRRAHGLIIRTCQQF